MTAKIDPEAHKGHYNTRIAPERERMIFEAIVDSYKTPDEISLSTGISRQRVMLYSKRLMEAKKVYIAGFKPAKWRGPGTPIFAQGDLPNAVYSRRERAVELSHADISSTSHMRVVVRPQTWYSALFAPPAFVF